MSSLGLLGDYCSDSSSDSDKFERTPNTDKLPKTSPEISVTIRKASFDETGTPPGCSFFDADKVDSTSSDSSVPPSPQNLPVELNVESVDNLPLPLFNKIHSGVIEAVPGSVFSNPYKEAEDNKLSALKHHVALAPSEVERKNDVKFSWKGKRRRRQVESNESDPFDKYDSSIKTGKLNRVKAGLPSGLVPPQKYLKLHQRHQAKERPWTVKK